MWKAGGEYLWPVTMLIFVFVLLYGKKLLILEISHQTFAPIGFLEKYPTAEKSDKLLEI